VNCLLLRKLARPLLLVTPVLAALAFLPGCGSENYSDFVEFKVRTDPVFLEPPSTKELPDPERPGKFPLLSMAQLPNLEDLLPEEDRKTLANKMRDPGKLTEKDRLTLQGALQRVFGTPAQPRFDLKGTDSARKLLRLERDQLEEGGKLYRVHCLQCHGVPGDGRGPTAQWVNPHPRDYRSGLFKFQSVDQTVKGIRKPARSDLYRVLQQGVEGTAMPAFNLMPERELNALVSYVIFLSIRGEAELKTIAEMEPHKETGLLTTDRLVDKKIRPHVELYVRLIAKDWEESQGMLIQAGPYPYKDEQKQASVRRGHALFTADEAELKKQFPDFPAAKLVTLKAASCISCHKDYGREAQYKFDKWGTLTRPANLTQGVYRGGRRPIDIYWRIHSGINGCDMQNFGRDLTPNQIWDLVNFVQALPYPRMLDAYEVKIR
jgi:mono/diheme cytochrome c family protein